MEQEFDLKTYLRIVRRRIPHIVIPFVLVFAASCIVVYVLKPVYHASARILVESQQIPDELARSTVTSAAAERIAVIRQRLMTRSNLLQIVREFDLFRDSRDKLSPTAIVDLMRQSASIELVDIGNKGTRGQQTVAFTVSFDYYNSQDAAKVANRLVELILEQNIQARTSRASKTYQFFERQVADLEKQLTLKQADIVKFKSKHEDALPDSLAYRRTLLTDLQSRIPEIDQKIRTLSEQRELLKAGEEIVVVDPVEKEIAKLEMQLQQLKENYSDQHPSVKRVSNRISALKKTLESSLPATAETEKSEDNPDEQQKVSREVAAKLSSIDRQIAGLNKQRSEQQQRIAKLEEDLAQTPRIEILLGALTREYSALEQRLSQARAKMAEAATGEQLEEDKQSERFEVIERAAAPSAPAKPDRRKLILMGLLLSIATGAGIAFLFEMLDKSVRSSSDLQTSLKMRPLSTIPFVVTAADRRKRMTMIWATLTGGTASAAVAVLMVHVFYRPIDVVWLKILQKLPI